MDNPTILSVWQEEPGRSPEAPRGPSFCPAHLHPTPRGLWAGLRACGRGQGHAWVPRRAAPHCEPLPPQRKPEDGVRAGKEGRKERRKGRMAGFPLLPMLLLSASPGAAEPGDGEAPGSKGVGLSCLAAAPSLSWFLKSGESSLLATAEPGGEGSGSGDFEEGSHGTFAAGPQRLERPLNCSATDLATGRASSAPVLLDVQFHPELVRLEAHHSEGPGLLLVLLVLVEAHPPAQITWVDPEGQTSVNTSHFLIVEAKTFPWPSDHNGLHLQLRGLVGNRSIWVEEEPGSVANTSVLQSGLLDLRIELPLLALVVGAALALGAFLCLGALLSCLLCRKGKKKAGHSLPAVVPLPSSDSNNRKPQAPRMPRANVSLPANLQLNDLTAGRAGEAPTEEEEEERAVSEPENRLVLLERGWGQFPMVGYIYRASSMSSDEIWL
ncbi:transmembrane protein 25 isoform X2 [Anolis carolinensis]|uniref:transmembrane protein 25 isoform X2 n=1 Tax=Anolis carolinensis TaxID=28377 RepID=UPI002F2B8E3B